MCPQRECLVFLCGIMITIFYGSGYRIKNQMGKEGIHSALVGETAESEVTESNLVVNEPAD